MRMIRVYPMRGNVPDHPTAGRIKDGGLGTLWPADQFTFRRIADGDISKDNPDKSAVSLPDPEPTKPASPPFGRSRRLQL